MRKYIEKAKKYYVNFRGWSTRRKLVIIESDDWGSIRSDSPTTIEKLAAAGVDLKANPFSRYDTLESAGDLARLFEVLKSTRDSQGNYPVITANTIVANPDFARIQDHDFQAYYFEDIRSTYERKYPEQGVLDFWRQDGMKKDRLLWPQFHGREHFNYIAWLEKLQSGDLIERLGFDDRSLLGLRNTTPPFGVNGYMAAFDARMEDDYAHFGEVIKSGTDLFQDIFGFRSTSFVAPCSIRSDKLDAHLKMAGIRYHQMGQQTTPVMENYQLINRFWGDMNRQGQLYWRRNSTFEPYKSYPGTYRHQVLEDASIAFRCGKPLVINSHRINFVSGIEPKLREYSLDLLHNLLQGLVKQHPEIEFMSSDQLGEIMTQSGAS